MTRSPPRPKSGTGAAPKAKDALAGTLRGKLVPPYREFTPVVPVALETLTRLSSLPRLVAACAPVGYGKTVLLSLLQERQEARGHRTVWVSLDDRDRTVGALISLLRSAIALKTGAGSTAMSNSEEEIAGLDAPEQKLLSALNGLQDTTVLLIDNFHFCTDPRAGAALERLLHAMPAACRLVVSSTSTLPMDLVRAKMELGAQVLDASQLAFDRHCIEGLFQAHGLPLRDEALADRIARRTEGWPAAVRLLLILSQSGMGIEQAVERFTGDNSDIASVLTRGVLAGFDPALVNFLHEIALLREFSTELSVEVTGDSRAAEWIGMLLERNVLVFPLDQARNWLRMHTLLRQFLLAEGRSHIDRQRRRTILERAARWHVDHGDDAAAIDLALEAPSYALASACIERASRELVGGLGQLPRFMDWAEHLMAAGAPLGLETHAWYIWCLCFSLKYEAAQRAIEALDARLETQDLPAGQASAFRKRLGLLRVVVAVYLDNMELALREANEWLANASDQDALGVATVACGAAVAKVAAHDFVAARWHIQQASGAIVRAESPYGKAWVAAVQACIEISQGNPVEADGIVARARPPLVDALGPNAGALATLDFVHARALADLGRTNEAQNAARRGLAHAAHHGVTETSRYGLSACLSFWDGEPEGPWSPVELRPAAGSHGARLVRLLDAMIVRRLVQLGRLEDATFIAERLSLIQERTQRRMPNDNESTEMALARIEYAMAAGQQRDAFAWIEARLAYAQGHSMRRELVELHLLAASGHARHDDGRHALRHLTRAIATAAQHRLVGPFAEQMGWIRRVLETSDDRAFAFTVPAEKALLKRLREWARPAEEPVCGPSGSPVQPLTPREVQFLDCLALGLNNKQIADRADLSVETVKWHLYNLYGKLAVKNRTAAIASARTLGLLKH